MRMLMEGKFLRAGRLGRSFQLCLFVVLLALLVASCGTDDDADVAEEPEEEVTDPPDEAEPEEPEAPEELIPITYATSVVNWGRDAYGYVALELGYFEEEGFDVEVVPGRGSGDNLGLIAGGQLDYAPVDFTTLAILRADEDLPTKGVAFIHQEGLTSLMMRADSGIEEPADLEGRVIGGSPAGVGTVLLPLFAERAGFDADLVEFRVVDSAAQPTMVAEGQIDAGMQFTVGLPLYERAVGAAVAQMPYRDYLPELPGLVLAARDDTIEQEPEQVRAFVRALYRGLERALDEPEEAASILALYHPDIDEEVAAEELRIMRQHVFTEDVEEHGLGYIDPDRLDATLDIVREFFEVEGPIEVEDVYEFGFTPID